MEADKIALIDLDGTLDDYPPYVKKWLKHRPRGRVLMLATPYNQDYRHDQVLRIDPNNVRRVEIEDFVGHF